VLQLSQSLRGVSCVKVYRLSVCAEGFHVQAGSGGASTSWNYAPLIACARRDLPLRCETMKLLEAAGLPSDVLTCIDEFDPVAASQTVTSEYFRVTLVDHNALAPHLKPASRNVVEIVDHHRDMGLHPVRWMFVAIRLLLVFLFGLSEGCGQDVAGPARNVSFDESLGRGVGSTCTLVAEAFLTHAPACLHPDVAFMLLGVILVDTLNLDPAMNKTTPRDESAVSALLPLARSAFPTLCVHKLSCLRLLRV
jgi:exopolyphosphatase